MRGGEGGQILVDHFNPISTMGADMPSIILIFAPRFSDLPTALLLKVHYRQTQQLANDNTVIKFCPKIVGIFRIKKTLFSLPLRTNQFFM